MRGGGCPMECRCDSHGLWIRRRPVLVRYGTQENAISQPQEYLPSHCASLERVARVHSFYPVSGERMGPSPVLGLYAASFSEFIDTRNVLPSDAERIVSIVRGGQAYQVILQDQTSHIPFVFDSSSSTPGLLEVSQFVVTEGYPEEYESYPLVHFGG